MKQQEGESYLGGKPWYRTAVGSGKTLGEGNNREKGVESQQLVEKKGSPTCVVLPGQGED